MPTNTPANADAARLSNLNTILTTSKLDNAEAELLPTRLQTRVEDFLPIFRPVVLAVDAAMASRAKQVSEKDLAKVNLKAHVQDFFEALKRRTNRLKHNVPVLVHYGITQSGDLPAVGKEAEEVVPVHAAVREAEKAAASLRPDADDLLDDVKQELSHALRKETGPGERRVLRL